MSLHQYVNSFGQAMLHRYGQRVHKLAVNAGFTCPNRDGSKGIGGCTFCNNVSFSPQARQIEPIAQQIAQGKQVVVKRTGARRYLAYFQTYTNTYDELSILQARYEQALAVPGVIGISIGTRPDCIRDDVLDLLAQYAQQGYEVWLELGLQSSFDATLQRVNRGHGFAEYKAAMRAACKRGLQVCTHLIAGLPGEEEAHNRISFRRALELGSQGIKLHPLHVVKGTQLANAWRRQEYQPWSMQRYVKLAARLIEWAPPELVFHRLTATAPAQLLLAPSWCSGKWRVLNAIEAELAGRCSKQGVYA